MRLGRVIPAALRHPLQFSRMNHPTREEFQCAVYLESISFRTSFKYLTGTFAHAAAAQRVDQRVWISVAAALYGRQLHVATNTLTCTLSAVGLG